MIAFFDLASGASGDMLLAAAADAGRRAGIDAEGAAAHAIAALGLGCSVRFHEDTRGGLDCLRAVVDVPAAPVDATAMRDALARTSKAAVRALDAILDAEARVHGVSRDEVHLHDLGSADTAADIAGVDAALRALGVDTVAAAPVPAPRGWVGALPLPAPATLEILRGVPMYGVPDDVELVTPTAAAILVALRASFGPMPSLVLRAVGTGGGKRDTPRPNVCRLLLGSPAVAAAALPAGLRMERDVLLETNIDDQPPELLGPALDALLAAGAHDAWITPIVMKKSRPAFMLSILGPPDREAVLLDILFRQTTTLGARRREVDKWVVAREVIRVPVRGTSVRVKVGRLGDDVVTISPEFEDCLALAQSAGVPLLDVYAEASEHARRTLT